MQQTYKTYYTRTNTRHKHGRARTYTRTKHLHRGPVCFNCRPPSYISPRRGPCIIRAVYGVRILCFVCTRDSNNFFGRIIVFSKVGENRYETAVVNTAYGFSKDPDKTPSRRIRLVHDFRRHFGTAGSNQDARGCSHYVLHAESVSRPRLNSRTVYAKLIYI